MPARKSSRRISPGWIGARRFPVMTPRKSTRPASTALRLMVMASSRVIVDDLDIPCAVLAPVETDSPLIVDADAVLAAPAALQRLKAVARGNSQVLQTLGRIELPQLRACPS